MKEIFAMNKWALISARSNYIHTHLIVSAQRHGESLRLFINILYRNSCKAICVWRLWGCVIHNHMRGRWKLVLFRIFLFIFVRNILVALFSSWVNFYSVINLLQHTKSLFNLILLCFLITTHIEIKAFVPLYYYLWTLARRENNNYSWITVPMDMVLFGVSQVIAYPCQTYFPRSE